MVKTCEVIKHVIQIKKIDEVGFPHNQLLQRLLLPGANKLDIVAP